MWSYSSIIPIKRQSIAGGAAMFWPSVFTGLGAFLHWQTYVAGTMVSVLIFGSMALMGVIGMGAGKAAGAVGCLSMLLLPLVQAFSTVVFIFSLAPILLGISEDAAWSFPWSLALGDPWWMTKFLAALVFASVFFGIVPILGQLQSLQSLILGTIALAVVVTMLGQAYTEVASKDIHYWPGGWFVIGLVLISSALTWVALMTASIVSAIVDARAEGYGKVVAAPLAAVIGYIPVFIYAAWLGTQLHK
jgi:hypothetical protein